MSAIEPSAAATQHLTFFVGEEEYAVPVLRVREVVAAMPITPVPSTPRAVRGVANLSGKVVPVIDLGLRFSLNERLVTKWTCIVIVVVDVEGEPATMGLLVDWVHEIIDLAPGDIEPVPPFGVHVRVEFLRGVGVIGKRFVLLLDVDRTLSAPDLLAAVEAAEIAPAPAGAP